MRRLIYAADAGKPPTGNHNNQLVWLWHDAAASVLRENNDTRLPNSAMLKTRTVLALAYETGDFVGRLTTLNGVPALILGQASSVERAEREFAELMSTQDHGVNNPKAVVPALGPISAGWRRQYGWMVVFNPEPADYGLIWHWLQPSIRWIKQVGSKQTILDARAFTAPAGFRPMDVVFRTVFEGPEPV